MELQLAKCSRNTTTHQCDITLTVFTYLHEYITSGLWHMCNDVITAGSRVNAAAPPIRACSSTMLRVINVCMYVHRGP